VPWYVVGLIHSLESDFDFTTHLHNGDPLTARTKQEPAGRPANGSPKFTWAESALDALMMKGLHNVGRDAWSVERIAYELERYNGTGYRDHHPTVKTPYLWAATNQYTSGKYIRDHVFDPATVSDQLGAMALLKQLIDTQIVSELAETGVAVTAPVVASPVQTGLFLADGVPFRLRSEPRADADSTLIVTSAMPVEKVAEVDQLWWQVKVTALDMTERTGYSRRDWLKPQTVMSRFVVDEFAQACLDAARHYGTSAHFLIALADATTGLANAAVSGAGDAFGPFAFSAQEWRDNNASAETGYTDIDRFDPIAQAAIAGRFVVALTKQTQDVTPDKRLATAEELFLARLFGTQNLALLLKPSSQNKPLVKLLPEIDPIVTRWSALFSGDSKVADLRSALLEKMTAGFVVAITAITKIEPELSVGPAPASADTDDVPWMKIAKAELALKIKEFDPGSNPAIEKYFVPTTMGKQKDDVAWCGAFVSWCVDQSNGKHGPVVYSALASDWLNNGKSLPGPQYGAIAVTKPLAAGTSGHVGFVDTWDGNRVTLLGGNQGNAVCEKHFDLADIRSWRMV
jgi:uncharacterized protein (TIGR02594 family)